MKRLLSAMIIVLLLGQIPLAVDRSNVEQGEVLASPIADDSVGPERDAEDGLVAQWHFEGDYQDNSVNGNHGERHGDVHLVDGVNGKAACFDGDNDYITVHDAPSLDITDEITIEAWVKLNELNRRQCFVGKREGMAASQIGYLLKMGDDNSLSLQFNGFGYSAGSLRADVWQHVAGTYDGSTINLYIDGVKVGSESHPGSITSNDATVYIGAFYYCSITNPLNGLLDEVAIYNKAMTEHEIARLYNNSNNANYTEQNEFGGSWFDDFEDEDGIAVQSNITISDSKCTLERKPVNNEYFILYDDFLGNDINTTIWDLRKYNSWNFPTVENGFLKSAHGNAHGGSGVTSKSSFETTGQMKVHYQFLAQDGGSSGDSVSLSFYNKDTVLYNQISHPDDPNAYGKNIKNNLAISYTQCYHKLYITSYDDTLTDPPHRVNSIGLNAESGNVISVNADIDWDNDVIKAYIYKNEVFMDDLTLDFSNIDLKLDQFNVEVWGAGYTTPDEYNDLVSISTNDTLENCIGIWHFDGNYLVLLCHKLASSYFLPQIGSFFCQNVWNLDEFSPQRRITTLKEVHVTQ